MDIFTQAFNLARENPGALVLVGVFITVVNYWRLKLAHERRAQSHDASRDATLAKTVDILGNALEDTTDVTRQLPETLVLKVAQAMQPAMIRLDRIEENLELITAMLARMETVDDCLRVETAQILGEVRTVKDQLSPVMHSLETGEHEALTWATHEH